MKEPIDLLSARLSDFLPLPEGELQYSWEYVENNAAVVLRDEPERVLVGVTEKTDSFVLKKLPFIHKKTVEFRRLEATDLAGYLSRRRAGLDVAPGAQAKQDDGLALDVLANDAPIVNLVNGVLIEGIRERASDVHIEAGNVQGVVRFRVDGVLRVAQTFPLEKFPAVASRIKIMAGLNILERRLPQDGRATVELGGRLLDIRVSAVPIAAGSGGAGRFEGESLVLRLLQKEENPLELDALGFDPDTLAEFRSLFRKPSGLVLVTGPTGSGKTTSLHAALREIRSERIKILTIEDPIEYRVDGICQIQTNERIGLGFGAVLKRILRQDPDVIMVGEIRDPETAELAMRAALTGHLVLSTLHTRDAVSSVLRLRNMKIEPYLLSAVFRGAAAQRLVRRVCPECRRERKPDALERAVFERNKVECAMVSYGAGCDACRNTGFHGRVALVEIFTADEDFSELVVRGARTSVLLKQLEARGFRGLFLRGLDLVASGGTTLEEVERAVG